MAGGTREQANLAAAAVGTDPEAVRRLAAENDRLRARVAELEAIGRQGETSAPRVDRHPILADAPLSPEDALRQAADLRLINERLHERYYERKLFVVACLEKSGSTSLEICLREMLRFTQGIAHDIGIQQSIDAGPFAYVDALYPEILLYARDGGVLRSFLAPSTTNVVMLNWFVARYFVLLRHPADRLVARYCQPPGYVELFRRGWRIDPGYMFRDVFGEGRSMEDEFEFLIADGYLLDSLIWAANWLRLRHPRMSTVLRYEDLVSADGSAFDDVHRFMFGLPMRPALRDTLSDILARYRDDYQPASADARRYPKGYSGEVGVYRAYFTDRNVASYNRVVGGFLDTHPHAALVAEAYPDLVIAA